LLIIFSKKNDLLGSLPTGVAACVVEVKRALKKGKQNN
jgi:hypothetical protein